MDKSKTLDEKVLHSFFREKQLEDDEIESLCLPELVKKFYTEGIKSVLTDGNITPNLGKEEIDELEKYLKPFETAATSLNESIFLEFFSRKGLLAEDIENLSPSNLIEKLHTEGLNSLMKDDKLNE